MKEGTLAAIPNRADGNILALYTDYESDEHGVYAFVLGARVTSTREVPPGMVAKRLPAADYAVLTSRTGPVWDVVPELWRQIWTDVKGRTFQADFEVYGEHAADPSNARVEIHVGVTVPPAESPSAA